MSKPKRILHNYQRADGDEVSTGNLTFQSTVTVDAANNGVLMLLSLPTSDPHVVGQVYVASGALKVSAG